MRVDTREPDVTLVQDRPVLVPAFCLLFALAALWALVANSLHGSWNAREAFGVALTLTLGVSGFLCTARRDAYRFDGRRRTLSWTRRSLLGRRRGSMPFDQILEATVHRGPMPDDKTWRVVLRKADGSFFPLSHAFTWNEARQREVARVIEETLEPRPRRAA